ncbi:MAG: hypothetical protein IID44_11440 [Planctomycetes bacterium]|nr:hypothetical protein [Planctomycetota bacterium]
MRPFLLVAITTLLASAAMARDPLPAGRPIPTRQSAFSIPFSTRQQSQPPTEVRLYVRQGPAGPWQFASRAKPADRRFEFSAPLDGQFAFSVREVDAAGREYPGGPHVAELTVLVDTREPTLRVTAGSDAPGEVTVRWDARDANLETSSLNIEYRTDPRSAWRKVAIGSADLRDGRVTWRPGVLQGTVELQAEVSDVAGNRAVWSGRAVLAGLSTSAMGSRFQQPGDPFAANRHRPDGSVAWSQAKREDAEPKRPVSRWASQQQPPVEKSSSGVPPFSGDFATRTEPITRQDSPSTLSAADAGRWRAAAPTAIGASQYAGTPTRGANASGGNRPLPQVVSPQQNRPAAASAAATVRSVGSSRLEIPYDDRQFARSGVRAVQVWWTRDEGRSWSLLDTDRDVRSPAVVSVEGEGTFGFRVVALGARGAAGQTPRAGEQPAMMLAVDLTRPVVRIAQAQQTSADTLTVRWQASDTRLAERPISLSYSITPSGRRVSIAAGIANTGSYLWRFDGRVPRQFYLHVAAQDAAGNIGRATFGQPISITRRAPQVGTARNRQPSGTSAIRPRRYQFY